MHIRDKNNADISISAYAKALQIVRVGKLAHLIGHWFISPSLSSSIRSTYLRYLHHLSRQSCLSFTPRFIKYILYKTYAKYDFTVVYCSQAFGDHITDSY